MSGTTLRLGGLQIDAFAIFVEEAAFPGRRCGALVTVDPGAELAAWRRLTDAANSADESGWSEHRDALTRLASRVGRAGR